MDEQIKALVAIGASAAVNCRPCLQHHLETCDRLGIDRADVQTAVEVGLMVARGAASKTSGYVEEIIGNGNQAASKNQKRDSGCGCAP
ncbi:MAG: carboxymuconolactone decarboxylase family protein [Myxococcales bacterium]|nr:carboxymuconolactone decarboxylase family protein [Myxococcales bacterium]MDH3484075.1 carboxymuconolactone decarboxylase family protein [Myxococcales bacterium]